VKPRPEDAADPAAANARFLAEVEAYGLRFRCSACAHVVPAPRVADLRCSLGYPNPTLTGPWVAITDDGQIAFCKYFELGEGEVDDPIG